MFIGTRRLVLVSALLTGAALLCSCVRDPETAKAKYLARGRNYMEKQQYGDAVIEFRNALRIDPRFVDAYYQLAQVSMAQLDWSAAYASLEKAVDLDPTRLDARLDFGRLCLASRDFDQAQTEAEFILDRDPRNIGSYQLLGAALIGKRQFDQALTAFAKITALQPKDPSGYVNLALVEISLRRYVEAERHLKKAVVTGPKFTQAYTDLANFYRLQNRGSEAQTVLEQGITANPEGIPLYITLAELEANQGRTYAARVVLQRLKDQQPNSSDAAMAIGDFYLQLKSTDQALAEYQHGLSISPGNLEVRKRIQELYLSTKQTSLAAEMDRSLQQEAPKDVLVRVNHGRLLLAQGHSADAVSYLQNVAADAPDSAQAHYYLADAYWQSGWMAKAQAELLAALKVSPELPAILQALTRLGFAQNDPAAAQSYAVELVEKHPADTVNRELLAEALFRQGKYGASEEQLLVVSRLVPDDASVHLSLAHIYEAKKENSKAQEEFETALQLEPHNSAYLGQLCDFLTKENQQSQALVHVKEFISANGTDATAHVILGALEFSAKDFASAQSHFEEAIKMDPRNIQAFLRLGKLHETSGRTDQAIEDYRRALALQPGYAALATMIGNLYLERGDVQTARSYFQQALSTDPNFAVAIANVAWLDAQEGKNLDIALGMAQRAKSLSPEMPSITDTLGWVMYKKGSYASAVPLLEECVAKSPASARFHYHLGMTLLAAGQKGKAKQQLQSALHLNLDPVDAQEARHALTEAN